MAGVLLAFWLTPEVARLLQEFGGIASRNVTVNWRVIGAMSMLATACAGVCGLLPAVIASRRNVAHILRRGLDRRAPGTMDAPRIRHRGRLALRSCCSSSVSLVGRSLLTVLAIDPGFEPAGVVTAGIAPPPARYPTDSQLVAFYATLESEVSQRLGARAVGIISEIPLSNDRGRGLVSARPTDGAREAVIRVASTAYFDVMRIAVVAGRPFDRRDDALAPARVVISESLAARLFPRESAIGRSITLDARDAICGSHRRRARRQAPLARRAELPTLYLSMWQFPSRGSLLVLRTTGSDRDAIAAVREQVAPARRRSAGLRCRLDGNVVARSPGVPARRVLTAAFLGFALLAVVLGAIGLFGVVAHEVARAARGAGACASRSAPTPRAFSRRLWVKACRWSESALVIGGVLSFWASRALAGVTNTSGSVDVVSAAAASPPCWCSLASAPSFLRLAARRRPIR